MAVPFGNLQASGLWTRKYVLLIPSGQVSIYGTYSVLKS